jgi:hypothetical protein
LTIAQARKTLDATQRYDQLHGERHCAAEGWVSVANEIG